jgi:membrane fusion protein, heavy metal efflux system
VRGERLGGEIFQVGRTVDPVTQTVLVRAAVENIGLALRAAQVLPARISTGPGSPGALAVPMPAIARMDGQAYVFARNGASLQRVPVTIVGEDGALAHVRSDGLGPDSEVAIRGVSALKAMLAVGED